MSKSALTWQFAHEMNDKVAKPAQIRLFGHDFGQNMSKQRHKGGFEHNSKENVAKMMTERD